MSHAPSALSRLARELDLAIKRYTSSGAPICDPECPCPVGTTLRVIGTLVSTVQRFDAGEFTPEGLSEKSPVLEHRSR